MKKESFETEYENVLYNLEYCRDCYIIPRVLDYFGVENETRIY